MRAAERDARSLKIALFERLKNRARTIADSHLRENIRDVILDGAFGNMKRFGNFAVAVAAGHQSKNFYLAFSKRIRRLETRKHIANLFDALDDALCNSGLDHRSTVGQSSDCVNQLFKRYVLE